MQERDRILGEIRKLGEKLGRAPSQAEFRRACRISWHQVYKHFRGMRGAVRAAGLEPGPKGGPLDERALVLDWARVVRELGRLPSRAEYNARGKHHAVTLHARVGWHQMAHRFVLLIREFHLEREWEDVEKIVLRKYPLLERSVQHSAISLQPQDIWAEERKHRVIPPQPTQNRLGLGAPVIGRSGDLVIPPHAAQERRGPGTPAIGKAENLGSELSSVGSPPRAAVPQGHCHGMRLGRVVAAALAIEILVAAEAKAKSHHGDTEARRTAELEIKPEGQLETRVEKRGQAVIPIYGEPLGLAAMAHAPTNEDGVLFLFGVVAADLGFRIERVQRGFPDVEAKREVAPGIWELQLWELEWLSRNFKEHKHDPKGCHGIICWKHNWPDCPEELEVIELSRVVKGR
jgi:Homing endonuclease associated repeat